MGNSFFNEYPYTDFHELNLSWVIKELRTFATTLEQFVSINALKYADPIQWNITTQYEKNTIVIDPQTGTAYISVAPVPAGVALTNQSYWTIVFDLGAFVVRASKNFASVYEAETTTSASVNIPKDTWLVWGDTLYKANVNITAGDTYVPGANISHFTIEDVIGHLNDLTTTDKTNLVNAINELVSSIGDLDDLTTTDKSNLVNAINEIASQVLGKIGDLNDLTTTDKSNLVSAINEVLTTLTNTSGDLANLDTTDKSNLVGAINEITGPVKHLTFVNVKDYGAKGDGVTDDTTAFQTAFDSGKNVFIPMDNGEIYLITDTVYFRSINQKVFGEPSISVFQDKVGGCIYYQGTGFLFETLNTNSISYLNIRGKELNDSITTGRNAINVPLWEAVGSSEVTIDNCMFYGFDTVIHTYGRQLEIRNNMFQAVNFAISLDYSTTISDPADVQGPVLGWRGVRIHDNRMHTNSTFIIINTGNLINAEVSDNILDLGSRLVELASGTSCKYSLFTRNVVTNSNRAIFIWANDAEFEDNIVDMNVFLFNNTNDAGYMFNNVAKGPDGCSISNNIIGRCNTPIIRCGSVSRMKISNNKFVEINNAYAISFGQTNTTYENCVITDNIFVSLTTASGLITSPHSSITYNKCSITGNQGNWSAGVITGNAVKTNCIVQADYT